MHNKSKTFYGTSMLGAIHACACSVIVLSATSQNVQAEKLAVLGMGAIEEVVVSARRRGDENLQGVPVAVSVFSSEDLTKSGIIDFSDVAHRTPGFTFQEQIGNQQELVIRGIGTLRLTGSAAEPSVGTFVDEVYIGRRGAATPPIFDLERAEVVRGPQGTLYGKNVVGGAINLITAKPSHESSGMLRMSYGEYSGRHGRSNWGLDSYITGSLGEKAAGRLAVHYIDSGGYARNVLLDEKLEDQRSYAVRGSLIFTPSDRLDMHVVAEAGDSKGNGQSRRAIDDPTSDDPGAVSGSGVLPDNIRESLSPWTQWDEREFYGLTARVDYLLSDSKSLTYLTSVRSGDYKGRFSLPGVTSPPSLTDAANGQIEEYTGVTQDVRVSSSPGGPMNWLAGLYYLRESTTVKDRSIATTFLSFLGPGSLGDILDGELFYDQKNITESFAVYGELSWDLSASVTVTAGGRFTHDGKDYRNRSECLDFGAGDDFIFCVAPLGNEFWDIREKKSWSEITPKLGIDWRMSDKVMLYGNAARGFKGGGWQGKPGTEAAARRPYDPETAWTFEVGAKTQSMDDRLRLNVAAFTTRFDDLQVEQLDDVGLTLIIDNAANAEITGMEVEVLFAPTNFSRIWINGSWIDSEYKDFTDSAGNDLSGNLLARTPEYMFSAGMEFSVSLSGRWELDAKVEYNWQDKMPWLVENTIFEDSYGLLDASIRVQSVDNVYEFELYGHNISNKLYTVDQIPFVGDSFARFGAPRSYGVRLTRKF